MRLWHYKLIPFLPTPQLAAQWRELNSIFKKQDRHVLIDYVYEYPKSHLALYSGLVLSELCRRGRKPSLQALERMRSYLGDALSDVGAAPAAPFPGHHTDRYLIQCFFNLQEKYDRGQKGFTQREYSALSAYVGRFMD